MSNEIAIKSHYVIEVQNGRLNFISRFVIFLRKRELCASALKEWATKTYLQTVLRVCMKERYRQLL